MKASGTIGLYLWGALTKTDEVKLKKKKKENQGQFLLGFTGFNFFLDTATSSVWGLSPK